MRPTFWRFGRLRCVSKRDNTKCHAVTMYANWYSVTVYPG